MSAQSGFVPLSQPLGSGTAGQNGSGPGQARDKAGTISVKALAARILSRDKTRDSSGTETPKSCPTPSVPVGQDQAFDGAAVPGVPLVPGVPPEWAAGHAAMREMLPPADISPERWDRLVRAAGKFLALWAAEAERLGWSTLDIFGAHESAPAARFDCMGLVLLLDRRDVVAINSDGADLVTASGARQRFRRRQLPLGTVSLWGLGQ